MHLRSLLTNKNRIIVFILVCIMALGILAGCGQNQVSDTSEKTAVKPTAENEGVHLETENSQAQTTDAFTKDTRISGM